VRKPKAFLSTLFMATLTGAAVGVGFDFARNQLTAVAASVTPAVPGLIAGGGDPNIFVSLAKKTVPSVVNIQTAAFAKGSRGQRRQEDLFRKFFEDFFRNQGGGRGQPLPPESEGGPQGAPRALSMGTGFVIDASGLILTNNHVVAEADEIKILFTEDAEEKPTVGEVVGRDSELDLALIRVKTTRDLVPLALGDSDALEVGEYVMAVGNPFGQGHSVTHGIISAKERKAPDFVLANYLQTDAPINPGNSGGPLLNLKGEVIGINNAIDQRAQGIGFAIPSNLVKQVLPQLKSKGSVSRGYIGVLVNEMTPEIAEKLKLPKDLKSPLVAQVYPGEAAAQAGVQEYDVILEFNGRPVRSSVDLVTAVTAVNVGDRVPMKVLRQGIEKTLKIKVSQRPNADALAGAPGGSPSPKKPSSPSAPQRMDVGMEMEDLTSEIARELGISGSLRGAVVSDIAYEGPADRAGLARGDVIMEVDRKSVKDVDGFFSIVKEKKSYLLRVRRADPSGKDVFSVIILDLSSKE
jgi:serine protease Do